jgi:hypothetical protein
MADTRTCEVEASLAPLTTAYWNYVPIVTLVEWPRCYCGEIRQMFTFLMNLYCPKFFYTLDHSISVFEYHMKNISLNQTSSPGLETRTDFWVCDLCSRNLLAETNNFCLGTILISCLVSKLQKYSHRDSNPGQFSWLWPLFLLISSSKQSTLVLTPSFYRT